MLRSMLRRAAGALVLAVVVVSLGWLAWVLFGPITPIHHTVAMAPL
jgi:hypothetical protein